MSINFCILGDRHLAAIVGKAGGLKCLRLLDYLISQGTVAPPPRISHRFLKISGPCVAECHEGEREGSILLSYAAAYWARSPAGRRFMEAKFDRGSK